jgi:hypothetical protein
MGEAACLFLLLMVLVLVLGVLPLLLLLLVSLPLLLLLKVLLSFFMENAMANGLATIIGAVGNFRTGTGAKGAAIIF